MILNRLFLPVFDTHQSKDDVIVTSYRFDPKKLHGRSGKPLCTTPAKQAQYE